MKESTLFSTLEKSCGSPPHATLQPSPIICNGPPDHSLLWPLHMCSLPRETHTPISIEWGRERNCSTERKDKAQLQSGWVSGGRNEQQYQCVVKTYKVKKKLDSCLHFPPIVPVGSCYRDQSTSVQEFSCTELLYPMWFFSTSTSFFCSLPLRQLLLSTQLRLLSIQGFLPLLSLSNKLECPLLS